MMPSQNEPKIGYACLTVGVPNTNMRTCRKSNATPEKLMEIIENNLQATENILAYNIQKGIKMYRLSSDLIPFGSDLATNKLDWVSLFEKNFARMAEMIRVHGIRVSMHPGQYTVLNSPNEEVVTRAIEDLSYHQKIMDALQVNQTHKIILHIGGVYGDKPAAMTRFVETYQKLSQSIKDRLIIENDDRLYTIEEVLAISRATGAPVVYDNLHNACNPSDPSKNDAYWVAAAKETWSEADGRMKIHYSQQRAGGRLGAHTSTIYLQPFLAFYQEVAPLEVDMMLEVKDKNLSAEKCLLATRKDSSPKELEKEWARYKYLVLLHSPAHYQKIRTLLKDKTAYPVVAFYQYLEEALETIPTNQTVMNALDHVWGHFKNVATEKEKDKYLQMKNQLENGDIVYTRIKNWLKKLAEKYHDSYLLSSLFWSMT